MEHTFSTLESENKGTKPGVLPSPATSFTTADPTRYYLITKYLKSLGMDKYDYLLLDIIYAHKLNHHELIRLGVIEQTFWKRIESDVSLSVGQAKIGERITKLYLAGYIQNKGGYSLTKRGREELSCQAA